MAIGENFNENGTNSQGTGKNSREYSYFPRLRIRKDQAKSSLSFEFRSGLLQFKITEMDDNGFSWNKDSAAVIYLSPTKAMLLADQVKRFRAYLAEDKIDENVAFGVNGGMGEKISYIAFHANADKVIFVTIGKFDGNGAIIESSTVELNKDYHYALDWANLNKMDITRVYDNSIELNQIIYLLEDFSRYMNGAAAYAQADLTRYDLGRVLGKLDPIYDKLGIERLNQGGRSYQNRGTNNFLNNTGTSQHTTLDSIEEMLGE
jgi:hypothetical protein